jgi:type IV secretory pathway VirB2 component (pilin)
LSILTSLFKYVVVCFSWLYSRNGYNSIIQVVVGVLRHAAALLGNSLEGSTTARTT